MLMCIRKARVGSFFTSSVYDLLALTNKEVLPCKNADGIVNGQGILAST